MNRGAQTIAELTRERGAQARLARRLRCTPGQLSRVARAVKVPGLEFRRIALRELGIAMEAWDEPALPEIPPANDGGESAAE